MKKLKNIFIGIIFSFIVFFLFSSHALAKTVNVYVFHGKTCPHCEEALSYLNSVSKYLKKGNKVAVVGSLQNRSYEDKDGVKRTVTDVIANEVEFLTTRNQSESASEYEQAAPAPRVNRAPAKPTLEQVDDDQLPF